MARAALLSLPIIGFWCVEVSHAPAPVQTFRILLTLAAVLPLGSLAFFRHELVDAERLRLLRASQESIDNLKRLQTQFVQSEKLASLGQLVGGAAHEINNPLTAILGYSELLADDPSADVRVRGLGEKIREQARRTKTLVNNLLSFARQTPTEQRSSLDVNTIVNSSVQFRRVDLRGKNIRIDVQTAATIPEVRGDANQLLQVFFNIINNAVDAMQDVGGGTLTVRTFFEKGNVVILFSDTGPGVREPQHVFDPFYTTKPVGKGTGLGLSICYGLVHDQGGQISCENRPEGGATFRIELPAVPALSPLRAIGPSSRGNPGKLA
jgi:two-component system NtrC family sensor kinase